MKRFFLRIFPYIVCVLASAAFYILGVRFEGDIKGLLHGISGSFLAIPLLYLIYELAKEFSNRKLNKELFDYAKMQIDQDILSIINQLMKLTLPYEEVSLSPSRIQAFLSRSEKHLTEKLENSEYLGFQVLKSWEVTEKNITKILENPFILSHLSNEQTIAIINLLKVIKSFDGMPKNVDDLYVKSNRTTKDFRIEQGTNINSANSKFPDRHLLLRDLGDGKYLVCDFGDFPKYQTGKLLDIYTLNGKYISQVSGSIYAFIKCINDWVETTGNEVLLNPRMYKVARA